MEIKYEGYISKQLKQVEQMRKLENRRLPDDFDYRTIKGLRLEAQEKLNKIKPLSIDRHPEFREFRLPTSAFCSFGLHRINNRRDL